MCNRIYHSPLKAHPAPGLFVAGDVLSAPRGEFGEFVGIRQGRFVAESCDVSARMLGETVPAARVNERLVSPAWFVGRVLNLDSLLSRPTRRAA